MDFKSLFEKYMEPESKVETPTSASIQVLEPNKMLGKSGISEEEFDKMFEHIIKR